VTELLLVEQIAVFACNSTICMAGVVYCIMLLPFMDVLLIFRAKLQIVLLTFVRLRLQKSICVKNRCLSVPTGTERQRLREKMKG
jgi:hypothetical protein